MFIGEIVRFNIGAEEYIPALIVGVNSDETYNVQVFHDRPNGVEHRKNVREGYAEGEIR